MSQTAPPLNESKNPSRSGAYSIFYWLLCFAVLTLSLALRLDGFRDDLWVDELHTAWVVDGPWSDLPERAAIGNQPPLYFAILKAIRPVIGFSEASLRLTSLLAGMALILLGWGYLWRTTHDPWAALVAMAAIGFDSSCIYYSSEARSYGLLQLCLAGATILVLERPTGWRSALLRALLAAIAIHLQFSAIFYLVPLYLGRFLACLTSESRSRRQAIAAIAGEAVFVCALCSPLALQLLEVGTRREAWETFVPRPSWSGLATLFPWTPVAIGVLAFFAWRGLAPSNANDQAMEGPRASQFGWLLWCGFAPVVLALVVAIADVAPTFYRRYLLAALWPLLMAPAVCLSLLRGQMKIALLIALLAAVVFSSRVVVPDCWRAGRLTASRGESWKAATEQISKLDPRGELPLFVASGFIESRRLQSNPSKLLSEYCLLPVKTLYSVPQQNEALIPVSSVVPYDPPATWVSQVAKKGGGIWILRVREPGAASWRRFGDRLIQRLNAQSTEKTWYLSLVTYPGIAILRIERDVQ
jgi:mannosyltransferase